MAGVAFAIPFFTFGNTIPIFIILPHKLLLKAIVTHTCTPRPKSKASNATQYARFAASACKEQRINLIAIDATPL